MSTYTPRRELIKRLKERREEKSEKIQLWQKYQKSILLLVQKVDLVQKKLQSIVVKHAYSLMQKPVFLVHKLRNLPQIGHHFFSYVIKKVELIRGFNKDIVQFFSKTAWRLRSAILFSLLLSVIIFNISTQIKQLFPTSPSVQRLNKYPTLPSSWTQLALEYSNHNQEQLAQIALTKAKLYTQYFPPPITSVLFDQDIISAERILAKPQYRRTQLELIERLKINYPYSWQLHALNARYQMELYQTEASKRSLDTAFWLSPTEPILNTLSQRN